MLAENISKFEFEKVLSRLSGDNDDIAVVERLIKDYYNMIEHLKNTKLYDVILFEESSLKFIKDSTSDLYYENEKLKKEINELRQNKGLGKKYK